MTGKKKNLFSSEERLLLKKHIGPSNFLIGKTRSCLDAVHASPPKRKEVLIAISGEEHSNKYKRWKRYQSLRKTHEIYTAEIARGVAKRTESSYFSPKRSRIYSDLNRNIYASKTINNISLIKTPQQAQNAIDVMLKNIFRNIGIIDSEQNLTKPFLHLSIHGKANTKNDLVIANGMKNNLLPCHPQLALWVAHFLRERIDKKYKVAVAREADALCGSTINVVRRVGLGENYQHLQIEISYKARTKQSKEIILLLSGLVRYFEKNFNSLEKITTLPLGTRDKHRLKGHLYYKNYTVKKSNGDNFIRLNPSLRKALGVKARDTVLVNKKKFRVLSTRKRTQNKKFPILLSKSPVNGAIVIKKTT